MSDFIVTLTNYSFMQHAVVACILTSIGCGIMGTYVVVKRIGFFVGGIAHTVFAGMGIAYFLQGSPIVGAVIAALFAAICMSLIKLYWRQREDILVGAFWSVGIAIGILFISRIPGYSVDLMSFLFGNILLVSRSDLLLMGVLDITIAGVVFLFYKQLNATVFDEEFAYLRGVKIHVYYTLLMCMVSLTVVLMIQIVGLILVMALLILPAACAAEFFPSILKMMWVAMAVCIIVTGGGLGVAYHYDLPAGATIVVVAGIVYLLSVVARKPFRKRLGVKRSY